MKIEIKHWYTGETIFEVDAQNIKEAVEAARDKGADLKGAYLKGAYLTGADLKGADLKGAYLKGAYLTGADLKGAYLTGADLTGADLTGADLTGADLTGADLTGAYLKGAYLKGADLTGARDIPFIPMACPSHGAFEGWKKVSYNGGSFLVHLLIPADARRSSAGSTKCRCDKAQVLDITDIITNEPINEVLNRNHAGALYRVGEIVLPDSFDDNRWNECSHGIHFFINKQEAIDYEN